MTPGVSLDEAMEALRAQADPARAAKMVAYHKTGREVLGLSNPQIIALADGWRVRDPSTAGRVALADGLWRAGLFESRIAAAKLLTQARIADDGPVWALARDWVRDFDGWAIADHAADVGSRRLQADPSRLDEVEPWLSDDSFWVRRATLVYTLPWAKSRHLDAQDDARRERILGWAARLSGEREWFVQKAVAGWLRTLSRRDPARVEAFLQAHGAAMKPFAVKDASRLIR